MAPQKAQSAPANPDFGPAEYDTTAFGPPEPATTPPDINAHAPVSFPQMTEASERQRQLSQAQSAAPAGGLIQRFGQVMGFPTSPAEVQALPSTIGHTLVGPYGTGPVGSYIQNIYNKATAPMTPAEQSDMAIHPVGQTVNQASKFMLEGPLAPVGGQGISNLAEDLGHGNLSGAAGDILGTVGNFLTLEKGLGPTSEAQLNKLTAAVGPRAARPLANTLDLLNQTKEASGMTVNSVRDFRDLINKAKTDINSEYGNALGPHANTPIYGGPIADSIRDLITPDMDITNEGRAEKAYLTSAAAEYDKQIPIGALDSKRSRLAADLAKHSGQEPVARYTAEKGNLNLAVDAKILQTLRDEIYPRVDVMAGQPSGYFEDLKQKQSNLIQLESLTNKRIDELTGKTREAAGTPLSSRVHGGISVSSSLTPHGYLSRFMDVISPQDVLGTANEVAGKGMQSKPSPVAKGLVMSYPVRALSANQPTPWWDKQP